MKTPGRDRGRDRRGYSLIETVVVVGAVMVVLSLCGLVLNAMFRLDKSGRSALADASDVTRLARQFRDDVRDASDATPLPSKGTTGGLALGKAGGSAVEYRVAGVRLIRTRRAGGKITATEGYRVDRLGPVEFKVAAPWVRLTLARTPPDKPGSERPAITVEAALGKDRALADLSPPGAKK